MKHHPLARLLRATGLLGICLALSAWSILGDDAPSTTAPQNWPPQLNQPYPDIEMIDATGAKRHLSEFKGKVIILKLIGMSCPACNGFSGAKEKGGYGGVTPQQGLESFDTYFYKTVKGASLSDGRIVVVSLLLYNLDMKAPTPEEVKKWAEHFKLNDKSNHYVFSGGAALSTSENKALIPGFQLIDKSFVLRKDSSGHHPIQNLYSDLMPAIPVLLKGN